MPLKLRGWFLGISPLTQLSEVVRGHEARIHVLFLAKHLQLLLILSLKKVLKLPKPAVLDQQTT